MANSTDTYLDIVDSEIPLFAYTTTAALVPAFTMPPSAGSYVLAISSAGPVYIRKGTALATTSSLRIPANTLYHLRYTGERISIMGDGVSGNASLTLMK
jgi:hypothetical protein